MAATATWWPTRAPTPGSHPPHVTPWRRAASVRTGSRAAVAAPDAGSEETTHVDDSTFMQRALRCGASVQGLTAPNPWVGCVVVLADGTTVEGVTHPAGGAHAEAHALAQLDGAAAGATLYVTLEPCSHHGRTPPCVDAI